MKASLSAVLGLCLAAAISADEPRLDSRLTAKPRDLDSYFPFTPPKDLKSWSARREELRTQLLVSQGLWPMPKRPPLNPTIHGRIDRDEYTVEKVFFTGLPGHYVTGNLYRPKSPGKHAAVLCPHGHWANGRMYDAGEKAAKTEMDRGGETWLDSARYILQAKCAQLARLGCVVFHFDMLGYADSSAIPHRQGFTDPLALLYLQSQMGLQTWNCIRSLDFVCGLPDVDPTRIGVTGGSGGGTQTFMLTALDDRVTAAFPAVMVSTAMQGGCVCENAPYLRIGTGNVEIAALCAPRPLGMTGAKDWTIDIERKGLPELKQLYSLYGCEERVMAWCFPQFGHNYNQVSREVMYNWFNTHLKLGQPTPVKERPFVPIPPRELSVFDAAHPRPKDEVGAEGVKKHLTDQARKQLRDLEPHDAASLIQFHRVVRSALQAMVCDRMPTPGDVEIRQTTSETNSERRTVIHQRLGRQKTGESAPALYIEPANFDGTVVLWVHPAGRASLESESEVVRRVLDAKAAILAIDVIGCGELAGFQPTVHQQYAGYTFGYNRPLVAERIHDILTAIAAARMIPSARRIHLVGWESAGSWVVMARAIAADAVSRCAADLDGFRFDSVRANYDPMMLPGALKYGGMASFAALCAPGDLLLHHHRGTGTGELVPKVYRVAGAEQRLRRSPEKLPPAAVVDWLLAAP